MTNQTNVRSSSIKPNAVLLFTVIIALFFVSFVIDLFPRPQYSLLGPTAVITASNTNSGQTPQP